MTRILNTTTVNVALGLPGMISTFNGYQLIRLRVLAIVAASLSIVAGLVGVYYLTFADRRKRMFRHEMILFLIVCDFIKALVLVIYPVVILINEYHYSNPLFFNILGWFTAFSIEGADFAVIFVAVHFALLIFKPNWKWRNMRTGNLEGGLYKYRAIIWPATFMIPSIMASLVFIDYNVINYSLVSNNIRIVSDNNNFDFKFEPRRGGFKPWSAWAYLPPDPLWYKYVLSWGLRYVLILFIIGIYLAIYIYVSRETLKIRKQLGGFDPAEMSEHERRPLWQKLTIVPFINIWDIVTGFFSLSLSDPMDSDTESELNGGEHDFLKKVHSHDHRSLDQESAQELPSRAASPPLSRGTYEMANMDSHAAISGATGSAMGSATASTAGTDGSALNHNTLTDVRLNLQRETYRRMRRRREQVQKNLRFIFIYPFSYLVIWSFPIASDISQTRHEVINGPIIWLSYVDTFIRPLSCLSHTFVFILREKPWNLAWDIIEGAVLFDEYKARGKITEEKIMALCNSPHGRRGWYYRGRWSKMACWKHQPQVWKRALWYLGMTVKGVFKLSLSYKDNCNDAEYWNRYYFTEEPSRVARTPSGLEDVFSSQQKPDVRRESVLSLSTNTSNRIPSSSNDHDHELSTSDTDEDDKFTIDVPWYWKVVHYFPMLHGIDLDELNRSLYLNYENDTELMGPGFQATLNKMRDDNNNNSNSASILTALGPDADSSTNPFSSNNIPHNDNTNTSRWGSNDLSTDSIRNTFPMGGLVGRNNGTSTALQFDMPVRNSTSSVGRRPRRDSRYDQDVLDGDDDGMDLLTFLKGAGT